MSACEACGQDSTSTHGRARRFCSDKCRCWARLHPGEVRSTGRECGFCRVSIDDRAAHARFCSRECVDKSAGARRMVALAPRQCCSCGVEFQPRRVDQYGCRASHGRRVADLNYRTRKRAATAASGVKVTADALRQRLSMYAGCWVCGGPKEQVDHVKPLARGGLHILANLRPICAPCNRQKSDSWPWAA